MFGAVIALQVALVLSLGARAINIAAAQSTVRSTASIAVLPLTVDDGDIESQTIADSLLEETINALTRIPELEVTSRKSSLRYKDSDLSLFVIGNELRVEYVVDGSVWRAKSRVRITLELMSVDDGSSLWRESFDRDVNSIESVYPEIAESVARIAKML